MNGSCTVPTECESEFVAWASCLESSITAGDTWTCVEPLSIVTCAADDPPCAEQQSAYDSCSL
jgi:hypothetical protein